MDGVAGWEIIELDTVGSTQEEVKARLRAGAAPPLAVRARVQTAGRGRRGNEWSSPEGGLWLSFAISAPPPADPFLGLLLASCAREAVTQLLPDPHPPLRLKWPNDLVLTRPDGSLAKWGGLIVEVQAAHPPAPPGALHLVFGLGLDLRIPVEGLPDPSGGGLAPTSILAEFDQSPSPGSCLPRILSLFDRRLSEDRVPGGRDRSVERILPHLDTVGRSIVWSAEAAPAVADAPAPRGSGRAVGLASDGGLIVEVPEEGTDAPSRRCVLRSGEVHHVREDEPPHPDPRSAGGLRNQEE